MPNAIPLVVLLALGLAVQAVAGQPPSDRARDNPVRGPAIALPSYPPGPCDTADVLTLIGKDGPFAKAPKHGAAMIRARIATCNAVINGYIAQLPTPPPALSPIAQNPPSLPVLPPPPQPTPFPTSPANCSPLQTDDPVRAYSVLGYCSGWIARNVSSPAPLPSATPPLIGFHTPSPVARGAWTKAVYVMALAGDAPTSAQISLQLADDLRDGRRIPTAQTRDIYTGRVVDYRVLAEPTWTLAQYQQQCFQDSSTAGAIVVLQPGVQTSSYNLLFSTSWTALSLQAIVLDCEPTNTAYVNNAAYITYITHVRTGIGRRYSVSLATMLGILAGILAVHPTRTMNYTVASPNPLPPGTAYNSGYTTGTNQGVGIVAAAGVAGLTPLETQNVGQGPGVDAQTAGAMAKVLPELLRDLLKPCRSKADEPSPVPSAVPTLAPLEPFATQCVWFAKPTGS
jgi:hypothetical protein